MTTTAERLTAWRSIHKIDPVEAEHPEFGRITRCSVDGIRVNWITKAWRHDNDEIVVLLDEEYGGAWGFPKSPDSLTALEIKAIERVASLYDPATDDESEFVDDEWTDRESQPEFNGSFRS